MQLIERLPFALCRFHTRSFILRSHVRLMRIECASNANPTRLMPQHVRQNVCDFHYLRENIYVFSTCKKQYYCSRNLCQLKTPCHRCKAFRAGDAYLMGIKCTSEGGIHWFTMYLKRIRKCNMVEQHKAVSLRSQIWESRRDTPDNNRILLKIKSLLFNFSPPPGVYGIFFIVLIIMYGNGNFFPSRSRIKLDQLAHNGYPCILNATVNVRTNLYNYFMHIYIWCTPLCKV